MLKEKTGEDLSARAIVAYFQPPLAYLQQQNKGRKYTMQKQAGSFAGSK